MMDMRRRWTPYRWALIVATDLLAWLVGALVSLSVGVVEFTPAGLLLLASVVAVTQIGVGLANGLYQGRYRVGGFDEATHVGVTWLATTGLAVALTAVLAADVTDALAHAMVWALVALLVQGVVRLLWRAVIERTLRPGGTGTARAVIVGAGEAGYLIVRGMMTDPGSATVPVALLDDDPLKARRSLMGIQVEGAIDDLPRVVGRHGAELVIIAIPSGSSELIGRVVELAKRVEVEVRTLPPMSELATGTVGVGDIRAINTNDLLGRAEVHVDMEQIAAFVSGRRVLVTGAGGSIGSELCRQLHHLGPASLVLVDRDESGLHGTQLSIEGRALLDSEMLVVADIRDRRRVFDVFAETKPEVVFHAAALKHLTLLERHPGEGIKTNIVGTRNVIDAALQHGVERFVNVSTDKAADPTSVLGATKLVAERLAADAATRTAKHVVSVRFGNVLGSRGSVLPTFECQIAAGGPVTVTHPDATRFFMTIPEAVRLVLQAGAVGDPGEVLILDMGQPVRIVEMAERLIDHHGADVEIEYTGLRPGEKLHEVLISDTEVGVRRHHPRIIHTASPPFPEVHCLVERLADDPTIDGCTLVEMVIGDDAGLSARP